MQSWTKASSDFARSLEIYPNDQRIAGWHLLTLAMAGNTAGHKSACTALAKGLDPNCDGDTANDIAWICARFPQSIDDLAPIMSLIKKAVASDPQESTYLTTNGAALYRARQFKASILALENSIKLQTGGGTPQDWLFLAMANHQLGNYEGARSWIGKAAPYVAKATPKTKQSSANIVLTWAERAELHLLCSEAEVLLKPRAPLLRK